MSRGGLGHSNGVGLRELSACITGRPFFLLALDMEWGLSTDVGMVIEAAHLHRVSGCLNGFDCEACLTSEQHRFCHNVMRFESERSSTLRQVLWCRG